MVTTKMANDAAFDQYYQNKKLEKIYKKISPEGRFRKTVDAHGFLQKLNHEQSKLDVFRQSIDTLRN